MILTDAFAIAEPKQLENGQLPNLFCHIIFMADFIKTWFFDIVNVNGMHFKGYDKPGNQGGDFP